MAYVWRLVALRNPRELARTWHRYGDESSGATGVSVKFSHTTDAFTACLIASESRYFSSAYRSSILDVATDVRVVRQNVSIAMPCMEIFSVLACALYSGPRCDAPSPEGGRQGRHATAPPLANLAASRGTVSPQLPRAGGRSRREGVGG